jgi:hypothetical protein
VPDIGTAVGNLLLKAAFPNMSAEHPVWFIPLLEQPILPRKIQDLQKTI